MAIWTRARLMWEIENSPFSYYQKIRDGIREAQKIEGEDATPLTDHEIDRMMDESKKLLNAFYYTYDSDRKAVIEIPGHLINRYGTGQFAFKADFASCLHVPDIYAISFGLDVVFIPIDTGDKPVFTLADARCFQTIYEYLTTDTPPEYKRLPEKLVKELEAYSRYLRFEGYDTGTVSD